MPLQVKKQFIGITDQHWGQDLPYFMNAALV